MPGEKNLAVWKGNTFATTFRFKVDADTALDLTGSTLVFRAIWAGGEIRKTGPSSDIAVPTPANGEATLNLSVADTRLIPSGAIAKYEIERRISGAQTTLLYGTLVASEWVNDDV
jgi:hypothetical protein